MASFSTAAPDSHFPQLGIVTDAAAMQKILQRQLPGFAEGGWQIETLNVKDFDYKPGRKCALGYVLHVRHAVTGEQRRQLFTGVIEPGGGAENKFAQAHQEELVPPTIGPAVHLLPELDLVLWGFPNDPKMKGLPVLFQESSLLLLLEREWKNFGIVAGGRLHQIETGVVKYVPQRRCTLRHVLQIERDATPEKSELIVYSKIYRAKTEGRIFFKNLKGIWEAPVCRSGRLLVPEPLFYSQELNAAFQRGLHGQNLDEVLHEIDVVRAAGQIGAALAGLQQCELQGLASRSLIEDFVEFKKTQRSLSADGAGYAAILQGVAIDLEKRMGGLPALAPVPIHGAFRPTQVLRVGEQLALIDFDGFLLGNPIADVGSFVAHLFYLPLKGLITASQSRAAMAAFTRAYRNAAPWGLPEEVLRWYTAANLAGREAKKCLDKSSKISKRDYEGMIGVLLEHARDCLAGKMV